MQPTIALAAIRGFSEDFLDGSISVPFQSIASSPGELTDDGLRVFGKSTGVELYAEIAGNGSFRSAVEFSIIEGFYQSSIRLNHSVIFREELIWSEFERSTGEPVAVVNSRTHDKITGAGLEAELPDEGAIARLETIYVESTDEVSVIFDRDVSDEIPPAIAGPFLTHVDFSKRNGHGFSLWVISDLDVELDLLVHKLSVEPLYPIGDFNEDEIIDVLDIDLLADAIRNGSSESVFDIDFDIEVSEQDHWEWVHVAKGTYFGDANLDGEFNSSDFVQVFAVGEYEDSIDGNSGWAEGDWNGDGAFSSQDFVLAFQDGGYEKGPRLSAHLVPEPSTSSTAVLLTPLFVMVIRRCN